MASVDDQPAPAIYVKLLNKSISKIDRLLKMILTPIDPAEGFVANFSLLFADDNTVTSFQKVLEMKVHWVALLSRAASL